MVATFCNSSELSLVYEAMLLSPAIYPDIKDDYYYINAVKAHFMADTGLPTGSYRMLLLGLGLFDCRCLFR
jgi:hypothetical protein